MEGALRWTPARGWRRTLKNHLLFFVARALTAALRLLPARLALALGSGVGLLAWALAGRERRRALSNLRRSDLGLGERAARRLVREVFVRLGRSAMECIAIHELRGKIDLPDGPVRFAPGAKARLEEALSEGKGVLFVTGHFANWELMAAAVARVGPVHVLARGSYDPRFTRIIERFRLDSGVAPIWVELPGHLRRAIRALEGGAILGVLHDQPAKSGGVVHSFLGQPAPTTTLAAGLARATGAAVIVGHSSRSADGALYVQIERIELDNCERKDEALRAGSEVLTRELERAVRSNPCDWLWTLDRWRTENMN